MMRAFQVLLEGAVQISQTLFKIAFQMPKRNEISERISFIVERNRSNYNWRTLRRNRQLRFIKFLKVHHFSVGLLQYCFKTI